MRIEIRSESVVIEGYVNAVGRDSRVIPSPMGSFVEQVMPKTFERALAKGNDVELRLNHEKVIGSTGQGNLQLREDNIGLYAHAEVSDAEVIEKAKKQELRGWSFAFYGDKDHFEDCQNGLKRRFLDDIELKEVSIIDSRKTPAYVGTSIEMRGEDEAVMERRGIEDHVDIVNSTPQPGKRDYSVYEKQIQILRMRGNSE